MQLHRDLKGSTGKEMQKSGLMMTNSREIKWNPLASEPVKKQQLEQPHNYLGYLRGFCISRCELPSPYDGKKNWQ